MTFSDLMNGDWVIRKGILSEPMQVVDFNVSKGLVFLDFQGRGVTENIENIEPIAITEEILVKNGFVKDIDLDVYFLSERDGINFWFGSIPGLKPGCPALIVGENSNEYHGWFPVKAVHELQHMLKIFNINKEIIL